MRHLGEYRLSLETRPIRGLGGIEESRNLVEMMLRLLVCVEEFEVKAMQINLKLFEIYLVGCCEEMRCGINWLWSRR